MFESHAQNFEDVVLWRALGHVEHGTYVDVGAADPDEDSVTKAFYQRGWTGLNVEPAAEYADRLRSARPLDTTMQVCAGEHEGTIAFHHVLGTGLSSVVESSIQSLADTTYTVVDVEVPMHRLDQILDDAHFDGREIHFLKVDVEGFEEAVLRGIDLMRWRPWVIVAEATAPRSPTLVHHSWEPVLLDQGYEFCLFDGLNRFYVAKEHAELSGDLSYPAGVFDQPFSTPAHGRLLTEYDNLLRGHDELSAAHQQALQAFERIDAQLAETLDSYRRAEALYLSTLDSYQQLHLVYDDSLRGYEELRDRFEQLGEERDRLREGVAVMGSQIDDARLARDAALRAVELMQATLSWRVTRPLRAVRRLRGR